MDVRPGPEVCTTEYGESQPNYTLHMAFGAYAVMCPSYSSTAKRNKTENESASLHIKYFHMILDFINLSSVVYASCPWV